MGLFAVATAHALSISARGQFVVLIAVAGIVQIVSSLGANISVRVLVSREEISISQSLTIVGSLAMGAGAVGLAAGWLLVPANGSPRGAMALWCAGLSAFGTFSVLVVHILYGLGRLIAASTVDAFGNVILLLVGVVGVVTHASITMFLVAYIMSNVLALTASLYVLSSVKNWRDNRHPHPWKTILSSSPMTTFISTSAQMTVKLDRYIISVMLGLAAVSVYSVAATMSELIWLIPISLSSRIMLTSAKSEGNDFEGLVPWAIICTLGAVLLAVASPWMTTLIFGQSYASAWKYVVLLTPGSLAMCVVLVLTPYLIGRDRTARVLLASIIGASCSVIGDVVLIRHFHIGGAAVACSIAYVIQAVVMMKMTQTVHSRFGPTIYGVADAT